MIPILKEVTVLDFEPEVSLSALEPEPLFERAAPSDPQPLALAERLARGVWADDRRSSRRTPRTLPWVRWVDEVIIV